MDLDNRPLVRLIDVGRDFDVSRPWLNRVVEGAPRQLLRAVDGVSFEVRQGETLALVGESGCGKSTVARLAVGLYAPTEGRIEFDSMDLAAPGTDAAALRRRMQMIFQDPYASLNPRWRVRDIVAEPIRVLARPICVMPDQLAYLNFVSLTIAEPKMRWNWTVKFAGRM